MKVVIVLPHIPHIYGGAEVLAEDLTAALRQCGHEADLLRIPFIPHPPEHLPDQMLACRLFDLNGAYPVKTDLVIGLKFPAYLVRHHNKTVWLCHQEKSVYDLWDSTFKPVESSPLRGHSDGPAVREAVLAVDRQELTGMRRGFTISRTVANRLRRHCQVHFRTMYPPARKAESYFCSGYEPFLFYPSRIDHPKRHELVLRALAEADPEVRLVCAGQATVPHLEQDLKRQAESAGIADRVDFLGWISEDEKIDLYARCRGVVFPPHDEDYGYVTVEAMLASKPVVTCTDAGGPLELVVPDQTGIVTSPEPIALGRAMSSVWNPSSARALGREGRRQYELNAMSWEDIVEELTAAP